MIAQKIILPISIVLGCTILGIFYYTTQRLNKSDREVIFQQQTQVNSLTQKLSTEDSIIKIEKCKAYANNAIDKNLGTNCESYAIEYFKARPENRLDKLDALTECEKTGGVMATKIYDSAYSRCLNDQVPQEGEHYNFFPNE